MPQSGTVVVLSAEGKLALRVRRQQATIRIRRPLCRSETFFYIATDGTGVRLQHSKPHRCAREAGAALRSTTCCTHMKVKVIDIMQLCWHRLCFAQADHGLDGFQSD
jgi:hypothetical protein